MRSASLCLVLTALVAPAAPAQQRDIASGKVPNPVRSIEAYAGRCQALQYGGADVSGHCRALLTNMHYQRGQSFQFWMDDPRRAISFFGYETVSGGSMTTLKVQFVTIAEGSPPTGGKRDAVGTCEYGDFTSGPVRVTCRATAADGAGFSGTYLTDGTPAEAMQQ